MNDRRYLHTATLLLNGDVLIAGGVSYAVTPNELSSAEVFDTSSNRFRVVGSMVFARQGHEATLLRDGRVLITGGADTRAAEIYDPSTERFRKVGDMTTLRSGHSTVLLPTGEVFLFGGSDSGTSTEFFNPATETFSAGPEMYEPNSRGAATTLRDGRLLC